jgi:hypothetical protein
VPAGAEPAAAWLLLAAVAAPRDCECGAFAEGFDGVEGVLVARAGSVRGADSDFARGRGVAEDMVGRERERERERGKLSVVKGGERLEREKNGRQKGREGVERRRGSRVRRRGRGREEIAFSLLCGFFSFLRCDL